MYWAKKTAVLVKIHSLYSQPRNTFFKQDALSLWKNELHFQIKLGLLYRAQVSKKPLFALSQGPSIPSFTVASQMFLGSSIMVSHFVHSKHMKDASLNILGSMVMKNNFC